MNKHKWIKLGQIFHDGYCANPTATHLNESVVRVYYSSRDINNKSSIFAFDYDLDNLETLQKKGELLYKYKTDSNFFSSGITPGCIYNIKNKEYLAFMGWTNNQGSHWFGTIGRLEIDKNYTFVQNSEELLLGLNTVDSISLSYPEIVSKENKYYMLYGSTVTWNYTNGEMIHTLNLAESNDGKFFEPKGKVLDYKTGYAQAFSRPTIYIDNNQTYHMWYSYRGSAKDFYKIGYAKSNGDFFNWENHYNKNQIKSSKNKWESKMVEYPNVIEHNSKLFMFYNGNDYGKTGLGLAYIDKKDL